MPVDYLHANADFLPAGYRVAHLFKRVYLGSYYPEFLDRLLEMKAKAAERGAHYYSLYGYRSLAQQADLRKKYLAGTGGKAAPAGLSGHNYGLADDSCADDNPAPGLQPTWDPKKYETLGEEAARVGLIWGASFGDRPHVQWPHYISGAQLEPLYKLWNTYIGPDDMRLRAIWGYLDVLGRKVVVSPSPDSK